VSKPSEPIDSLDPEFRFGVDLDRPVIIFGGMFLLIVLHRAITGLLTLGEIETILYAKQFASAEFIPGDWYLNLDQGVRRAYHILLYPFVTLLPLPVAAVAGRLLGFALVVWALTRIARRLGMDAAAAVAVLGTYLWLNQATLPPAGEWILKRTESKVIAYGLLLLALEALMSKRSRWVGVLAGAATTFHVLVGGWGTCALGLVILSSRTASWRERLEALAAWFLFAAPAVVITAARFFSSGNPAARDLYVAFRNPHHLVPSEWLFSTEEIVYSAILICALVWTCLAEERSSKKSIVAQFGLWTLLPYVIGLAVSPFGFANSFFQLDPFRVASTLVPLTGLIVGLPLVLHLVFGQRAKRWAAVLLSAYFIFLGWGELSDATDDVRRFQEGGKWRSSSRTEDLYDACHWIRANTPADALVLASPRLDGVQLLCRRPVVVRFRSVPSKAEDIVEWYQRLIAFGDSDRPSEVGYAAAREIEDHFNDMSRSSYTRLGRQYEASVLLVRNGSRVGLPRLYENDRWSVYALGDLAAAAKGRQRRRN